MRCLRGHFEIRLHAAAGIEQNADGEWFSFQFQIENFLRFAILPYQKIFRFHVLHEISGAIRNGHLQIHNLHIDRVLRESRKREQQKDKKGQGSFHANLYFRIVQIILLPAFKLPSSVPLIFDCPILLRYDTGTSRIRNW